MEIAFQEFGIEARIISVDGLKLEGKKNLEISLSIRDEKEILLKKDE